MKKFQSSKWLKLAFIVLIVFLLTLTFKYIYAYIDSYFEVPDKDSLIPNLNDPDKFIKYGYPEIKSLSIQFLTLVTAILVFSITFSEKIINYNQTKYSIRLTLTLGWSLLILAIVTNGIGLAYNAFAYSISIVDLTTNQTDSLTSIGNSNSIIAENSSTNSAINNSNENEKVVSADFYEPAFQSLKSILMSGVFFVSGLLCILIAGVVSIFKRTNVAT